MAGLAELFPNDNVWLTPRRPGSPSVCYGQPAAVIVRIEHPYVVVRVDGEDGERRIHRENIRKTSPAIAVKRRTSAAAAEAPARPTLQGAEEIPLF